MLFQTLLAHLNRATPCVWVSVAATHGSTPREAGAGMAVTRAGSSGTIGGGHLELKAIELAREWLRLEQRGATRRHYPLGPALGQCCGGAVDLLFRPLTALERPWLEALAQSEKTGGELTLRTVLDNGAPHTAASAAALVTAHTASTAVTATAQAAQAAQTAQTASVPAPAVMVTHHQFFPWHLWIFGAGHVGQALAQVFGTLPCCVTWVDGRDAVFPAAPAPNVTVLHSADPPDEVGGIPPGADVLVLTHSHALDLDIILHLLRRDDLGYLGLIGSGTKAQLFRRRLAARGIDASALVCPIGVPVPFLDAGAGAAGAPPVRPKDKHPGAIAVSVAADLLARRAQRQAPSPQRAQTRG